MSGEGCFEMNESTFMYSTSGFLNGPKQFFRANRQYFVNMDVVICIKPQENSKPLFRLRKCEQGEGVGV